MPFDIVAADCHLGPLSLHWRQENAGGDPEGGDALFVERERDDGAILLLLMDAAGHGVAAAPMVDLVRRLLADPECDNQPPAGLLKRLHGRLTTQYETTGRQVEALVLRVDMAGRVTGSRAGAHP